MGELAERGIIERSARSSMHHSFAQEEQRSSYVSMVRRSAVGGVDCNGRWKEAMNREKLDMQSGERRNDKWGGVTPCFFQH